VTAAPAGGWPSYTEELVFRAPILDTSSAGTEEKFTAVFKADNTRVWTLLPTSLRNYGCWTHIRAAAKTRNGRMAYFILVEQYLGGSFTQTMAGKAENTLKTLAYTGNSRRFDFERFASLHKDQHNILTDLTEHGYKGIDEGTKVRHLLTGIQDPLLATVKTMILADKAYNRDFDASVNLCKTFIAQAKPSGVGRNPRSVGIAAFGLSDINPADCDMNVEVRHYSTAEYKALTPKQKLGLKYKKLQKQQRQGGKPQGKKRKPLTKAAVQAVKAMISTAITDRDAADAADDNNDDASHAVTEDGNDQQTGNNRNNNALKRRKK